MSREISLKVLSFEPQNLLSRRPHCRVYQDVSLELFVAFPLDVSQDLYISSSFKAYYKYSLVTRQGGTRLEWRYHPCFSVVPLTVNLPLLIEGIRGCSFILKNDIYGNLPTDSVTRTRHSTALNLPPSKCAFSQHYKRRASNAYALHQPLPHFVLPALFLLYSRRAILRPQWLITAHLT